MDLNFTEAELGFRREIRQFLAQALPQDISHKVHHGIPLEKLDYQRWQRVLYTQGWGGSSWSSAFGGTD